MTSGSLSGCSFAVLVASAAWARSRGGLIERPKSQQMKHTNAQRLHCLATYHAQQAGAFVALRLRCFPVERPPTDRLRVRIKDQGNIRCGTDWEELARKGDGFRRIRSSSMVYLSECIIFIGVLVASVVTASQFWLPQWLQLHHIRGLVRHCITFEVWVCSRCLARCNWSTLRTGGLYTINERLLGTRT